MEFDTHLALIQGCLTHARRIWGPLDNITFDKDYEAVQDIIKKLEMCISKVPVKEINRVYMFLLLNCKPAVRDDDLQESQLSHLLGIAPILSVDVFLVLSVEVFGQQSLLFEAISVLPFSLSFELSVNFVRIYVENNFRKTADQLDKLCLALYNCVLTSKSKKNGQMFLMLLKTVLNFVEAEESKADSSSLFYSLKAVLSLLKSCLNNETLIDVQMWKDIYVRPILLDDCVNDNRKKIKNIIIKRVDEICATIPKGSIFELFDKSSPSIKFVRELAYECLAGVVNLSPSCDNLLNVLRDIAQKPECVSDKIKESSLSSLCSNAYIKSDSQLLWLKALIHHKEGLLNENALRTLHELVDLFDSDDKDFVCRVFHHSPDIRSESFRNLSLVCFSKLSRECKLKLLDYKIKCCGHKDFFSDGDCESHILEKLNKLVAQGEADSEEDQLIILAYKSPQLVVKHTLLTAASNKLFSESIVGKILQTLHPIFACPAETSFQGTSLTDVVLLDSIFCTNEIKKDLQGLKNLLKVLLWADLINVDYFLLSCVFPALFIAAKERQEQTIVLLLQILLDLQSEIRLNKTDADIATVLVFLGRLLEWFTLRVGVEREGKMVRDITIRNIVNIFSIPECVGLIQDKVKEWIIDELSVLSPENRHHFSTLVPQWMLFHGIRGGQVITTLATVLPYLHVTEWHMLVKLIPCTNEEDNFKRVLILCSAVNLIVRSAVNSEQLKFLLNLKSCVCNLGSVIQSCVSSGLEPGQSALIFQEFLALLELFPKSDQFDVAVFLLPIMKGLIDEGKHDSAVLSTFGGLLLKTSVQCVRRDLGRHLNKLC